jgi:hypothetical protein
MTFTESLGHCPQSGGGVHSWIMSCANVAAKEGISAEDAAAQIRANMTRAEKPKKRRKVYQGLSLQTF